MDHASLTKGKGKFEWMMMPPLLLSQYRLSFKTEKGGPNQTGVTRNSMLFQKSITNRYWDCHQDCLNLPDWMRYFQSTPSPSVDSLRVGWDKVVWNYPIPYFISYPCAIFSGTWVRYQSAENQVLLWMSREDCSQSVPPYHDSMPK